MRNVLSKLILKLSFYIQAKVTIPYCQLVMNSLDIRTLSFVNLYDEPIRSQ